MKAYVINLPGLPQRRSSMLQQLDRSGLEYEFVDAVDGHLLTTADRASLVDETAVARYPKWLTPGQVGCALSHLSTYQRIISVGGSGVSLVLEDDVVLPDDIGETASEIAGYMHGGEVVLLYFRSFDTCTFSRQQSVALSGGATLAYPLDVRQPITSAAYLITADASRRLADVILPVRAGADSWGHFYELGGIASLRCVVPRPVSVRKDFKSTTGTTRPQALRPRLTTWIARNNLFPLVQLLALNRYLIERRMSRIQWAAQPSQIAFSSDSKG